MKLQNGSWFLVWFLLPGTSNLGDDDLHSLGSPPCRAMRLATLWHVHKAPRHFEEIQVCSRISHNSWWIMWKHRDKDRATVGRAVIRGSLTRPLLTLHATQQLDKTTKLNVLPRARLHLEV